MKIFGRPNKNRPTPFRTLHANILALGKTERHGEDEKFELSPAQYVLDPDPLDSNGASVTGIASGAATAQAFTSPLTLPEKLPDSESWTPHDDYLLRMAIQLFNSSIAVPRHPTTIISST
jgi:hypothetical protein